jgi:hypothetical protein
MCPFPEVEVLQATADHRRLDVRRERSTNAGELPPLCRDPPSVASPFGFGVAVGGPCHGGTRGAPVGAPRPPASCRRACHCSRRERDAPRGPRPANALRAGALAMGCFQAGLADRCRASACVQRGRGPL